MANKFITCVVEDDGSVTAEATGYAGKGCVAKIAELLSILGGETISAGHKPEYHQNVVAETKIKAGR
jgi:Protein of unknown function (DUF2997)